MKTTYILFNGPPRSGKDEARKFLGEYFQDMGLMTCNVAFSDPLYDAVPRLYGIDRSEWDDRYATSKKDEPWDKIFGLTQRQALIGVAEDHMKTKHGKSVFAAIAANAVKDVREFYSGIEHLFILMDTGFDEEFETFVNGVGQKNCILVTVNRPGTTFEGDSRWWIRYKPETTDVLRYYMNNDETLEVWKKRVENVAEMILNREQNV